MREFKTLRTEAYLPPENVDLQRRLRHLLRLRCAEKSLRLRRLPSQPTMRPQQPLSNVRRPLTPQADVHSPLYSSAVTAYA